MRTQIFLQETQLRKAFQFFDKDNSGYISKQELKCVFETHEDLFNTFEPSDYDAVIDQADINKDGKISYDEFVRFMTAELSSVDFQL